MPYLALIYNTETLEVFKISSVISREPRRPPMGKNSLAALFVFTWIKCF